MKQTRYRRPRGKRRAVKAPKNTNLHKSTPSTLQRKYNVFHPTKSEIIDLYAHDHDNIYYDIEGRIYIQASPFSNLYKQLKQQGDIDDETTFLFHIFLPFIKKGLFVDNSRDKKEHAIELDTEEISIFPQIDDIIELINNDDEEITSKMKLETYCERHLDKRITTVILSLVS